MPARERHGVAALILALLAAGAGSAAAQTPDEPNLIFSMSAGYITGGTLWTLRRQLALAVSTINGNVWDSVSLGRQLSPGFAATLSATVFFTPHLGYTAEAGFFGIGSTSECAGLGPFAPTADNSNQAACGLLNGENMRSDAVGILGGLMWRFRRGGVQPYVRGSGGLAILGSSYVEEAATVFSPTGNSSLVYFLSDQNHKELTWMLSLGAGVMLPLGPGYQLRLEARDIIVPLPYPTGPATDTASIAGDQALPQPPVAFRTMHLPTITIGLDVVLERKRGHRY
jgi:hypothetical protein